MPLWFGQAEQKEEEKQQEDSTPNTRSTGRPLLPPLGTASSLAANVPPVWRGPGGRRTPSPRPVDHEQFEFLPTQQQLQAPLQLPPTLQVEPPSSPLSAAPNLNDFAHEDFEEEFDRISMASSESEIERLTRVAEAAIAAATAATTALQAAQNRSKKPELPPFDKKNVNLWIKRVESAYQRANITLAKDKFAHLEPKFPVDFNITINDFLFGVASDERWEQFLQFLKDEFGTTTRQQTAILLSSHTRSGLKPSQFLINLKDKVKKVSLDDIYKEILIKTLPNDVQHSLVDRLDTMTAEQTAAAADKYFDKEGRPISSSSSSSVNAIQQEQQQETPQFTAAFSDDEADVNFVSRSRFNKDNKFGGASGSNFRSKSRPRFNNSSSTSFRPSRPNNPSNRSSNTGVIRNGLCYPHEKFKDEAQVCYQGCKRFDQHKGKKVFQGNGAPERRA